ncbi:hypothetical protein [Halospeciosus flavus]|uniref:hypothetical protein n=1 Tax=Halospeciosus flavus TaxID=3032283 RepID=UPI00361E24BB
MFDRVKDYATTLDNVSADQNAAHITETIEKVTTYYDQDHDQEDLHDTLTRLHDVLDELVRVNSNGGKTHAKRWLMVRISI